jgi:hypothetical protein
MSTRIRASLPFVALGSLLGLATPRAQTEATAQAPTPPAEPIAAGPSSAQSPHGTLKIDCAQCHVAESWRKWPDKPGFKHEQTGFKLQQAHTQARCLSCHRSLAFSRVGTACADCHRDPHQAALGFECQRCHTPTSWTNQRDMANAHARTRFPLLGAHTRVDCSACHRKSGGETSVIGVGADYASTPTDCIACHLPDLQSATDPNHIQGGFSRRCNDCHGVSAQRWSDVSAFPHVATFPLTGVHATISCRACHTTGFAGTPRDCIGCHRADYDRARNPDHRSAGFPVTCQECHTTRGWTPATFDHDGRFFPINSGRHQGTWQSCNTCHTVPGNFRAFECITCHEHRRSEMDDEHDDVRGYAYQSPACYSCHPRGTE